MTRAPLISALLALASSVAAQGFTSPPGYISTEGLQYQSGTTNGYSYYLGRYADMHMQIVDGEIKAMGLQVLTSIGVRPDYRSHSSTTAMGRSWTNVSLSLSDGNLATMTTSFSGNQLSTPTTVFTGSVTWPSITGNPTSSPAPWDAAYAFPFNSTTSYAYTAANDLCLDFTFSGGTLANSASWSGSSGPLYYMDGLYTATNVTYGRSVFKNIGSTTGDCKDPGASATYAAASVQVGLYSKAYTSNPAWAGNAMLQIFGSGTAPNSQVIQAFSLSGTSPGVQFGQDCYDFMINLSAGAVYFYDTASATGSRAFQYALIGDLKTLAPYGSTISIWTQGAFTGSTSNNLTLTTAERCTPNFAYALNDTTPKMKATYNYSTTATTGFGPYDSFLYNPLVRYN
ncbi:MAG: hypothetical protein H6836_09690 [Planctomycetes bacterium]|nr:hypothetical protein [Planctomycetota bacterium]